MFWTPRDLLLLAHGDGVAVPAVRRGVVEQVQLALELVHEGLSGETVVLGELPHVLVHHPNDVLVLVR